jgi:hypothetical protein
VSRWRRRRAGGEGRRCQRHGRRRGRPRRLGGAAIATAPTTSSILARRRCAHAHVALGELVH